MSDRENDPQGTPDIEGGQAERGLGPDDTRGTNPDPLPVPWPTVPGTTPDPLPVPWPQSPGTSDQPLPAPETEQGGRSDIQDARHIDPL